MTEEYSPEKLLQIARGFMESRILLSAAELDLFTLLEAAPLSAEEIANKTGADLRALTALVDALAAMGLLAKTEAGYSCPPGVAHWLGGHSPKTILPMVHHMAGLWPRWSRLTAIVKGYPPAKEKLDLTQRRGTPGLHRRHALDQRPWPRIAAAVDAGTARRCWTWEAARHLRSPSCAVRDAGPCSTCPRNRNGGNAPRGGCSGARPW